MMTTPQQRKFKVLLIGDSCVDEYQYGAVTRISPEAPVPVFKFLSSEERPGMACNVKNNLEAFGCEVTFLTAEPSRKIRLVDKKSGHHIARIDHDPDKVTSIIFNPEMLKGVDIVVVSDYNKGSVASDLIMDLIHWFDGPVYIDTKKTDLAKFEGGIVKINQDEYSKITSEEYFK